MGCSSTKAVGVKRLNPTSEKDSCTSFSSVYPSISTAATLGKTSPTVVLIEAPLPLPPGLVAVDEDSFIHEDSVALLVGPQQSESTDSAFGRVTSTRSNRKCKALPRESSMRRNVSEGGRRTFADLSVVASRHPRDSDRRFIQEVLRSHFLFAGLEDLSLIANQMVKMDVSKGHVVFAQGQEGDCCYVVQTGTFKVIQNGLAVKEYESGSTFGELSLLYHTARTATIMCTSDGVLWCLQEWGFRLGMRRLHAKHADTVRNFLAQDPLFSTLAEEEQEKLAAACVVQTFQPGEVIMRGDEVGEWTFITLDGDIVASDIAGAGDEGKVVRPSGTIIGGTSLLYSERQVTMAKAVTKVTCMGIGRASFERLLGPLDKILRRSAIKALILGDQDSSFTASTPLTSPQACFRQLFEDQQHLFIDHCEDILVKKSEVIVPRGVPAQFVIVAEGQVAVVDDPKFENGDASPSTLRSEAVDLLGRGMIYGSQEVLGNATMPHTLVALTNARLHRIGGAVLREAFGDSLGDVIRMNTIKKVLSNVFLFKSLSEDEISTTVRSMTRKQYSAGSEIVVQGEDAKDFFLIEKGTIEVIKDGKKIRCLGPWDYFGERGLLLKDKRSASCVAESQCSCLVLDAWTFRQLVGSFRNILEQRMTLQDLDINMSDLDLVAVIGKGSFGTVKLVRHHSDHAKVYALKCVNKKYVVKKHQEKSVQLEREIGAQCFHPCIMQSIKTFQDPDSVYFLTEFLGGGDLFTAIREIGCLTKVQSQFYGGSICLALEYLHRAGIMYRDLKPENVLLDLEGYAKLVDFGCCKKALRSMTLVGTPEYIAPEIILGKSYTAAVDWWSLGVMMHEFIVGPQPFGAEAADQLELFKDILETPLELPLSSICDESAVSIINGLLEKIPENRLGSSLRGAKEVKSHPYFKDFNWQGLLAQTVPAAWKPDADVLRASWKAPGKGDSVAESVSTDGGEASTSTASSAFSDESLQEDDWCDAF
mmetsp:Transcript_63342/g.151119  ORF Transcript_63342/g.151119 Transcript_63342/m.151119 type:complete len:988 (-) Transcript_63342:98-3061(-)